MDISLGILSWKAYRTLDNTLTSYKPILELFNDKKIYFQEISQKDIDISEFYGIKPIGTNKNTGITEAFISLINSCENEYFIFAENDFELVHNKDETQKILEDSIKLLESYNVHIVKLRDRVHYGEPLYSYTTDKPNLGFQYKLESLHFLDSPEIVFPNVFELIDINFRWYKCSSDHQLWSNNVFMAKTSWLKDNVLPLLSQSDFLMENSLIKTLKNYNLAAGVGLFKHNRIDR